MASRARMGAGGRGICMHRADSLHWTTEANTTLQINYAPIKRQRKWWHLFTCWLHSVKQMFLAPGLDRPVTPSSLIYPGIKAKLNFCSSWQGIFGNNALLWKRAFPEMTEESISVHPGAAPHSTPPFIRFWPMPSAFDVHVLHWEDLTARNTQSLHGWLL